MSKFSALMPQNQVFFFAIIVEMIAFLKPECYHKKVVLRDVSSVGRAADS